MFHFLFKKYCCDTVDDVLVSCLKATLHNYFTLKLQLQNNFDAALTYTPVLALYNDLSQLFFFFGFSIIDGPGFK